MFEPLIQWSKWRHYAGNRWRLNAGNSQGRPYISTAVAEQLALTMMALNDRAPHHLLSEREFEIFSMLVNGGTVTDIGTRLCLSVKTVSTHKARMMKKMGMPTLSSMVQYAVTHQLVAPLET